MNPLDLVRSIVFQMAYIKRYYGLPVPILSISVQQNSVSLSQSLGTHFTWERYNWHSVIKKTTQAFKLYIATSTILRFILAINSSMHHWFTQLEWISVFIIYQVCIALHVCSYVCMSALLRDVLHLRLVSSNSTWFDLLISNLAYRFGMSHDTPIILCMSNYVFCIRGLGN